MSTVLFFALVAAASVMVFSDWRKGILLMIVAALLQDPVRKLMPGAPGYMVLAFIPIWLAVCIVVLLSGNRRWSRFLAAHPMLANGVWLLGFSLLLAFLVLILKHGFGALPVGLIGLLGYALPVLALAVGYYFVRGSKDILKLVTLYCVTAALLLSGGLLEYYQVFPDWPSLGTKALGTIWLRQYPDHVVYMMSGFFRSPDLMGWHAAMLVMFAAIMVFRTHRPLHKGLWLTLLAWGTVILLISGRNKMIFMPGVFVATVGLLHLYKGNVGRVMRIAMLGLIGIGLVLTLSSQLSLDKEFLLYTQKGAGDATARLAGSGLRSVLTTYRQSGFFGEGLGTASTGARYGGVSGIETWQESGPSKILVELGVAGFIAGFVLLTGVLQRTRQVFRNTPGNAAEFQLYTGLLAIAAANAASFVVSHQAFGDPFLVTLMGLFLGITLSAARWVAGPIRPR